MSNSFVVLITGDSIGKDAKELGEKLMVSFLYTLQESEDLPSHLLFLNTGVNLLIEKSGTFKSLQTLKEKGVKLLACGTCVDYFNLREQIAVGEISNMYAIKDVMVKADKLITF